MEQPKSWDLPNLERYFDNVSLDGVLNAVEALKNNCRDISDKHPKYSAVCGILKETEEILMRELKK